MPSIPIVVCTNVDTHINVLKASVQSYSPLNKVFQFDQVGTTFGESYNYAMGKMFEEYDEIIIANDDVVLTPRSMPVFLEDINELKKTIQKIGMVGVHSNEIRDDQNIKVHNTPHMKKLDRVSPIFAYVHKSAFRECKFPPLNWYSDDVMCEDLISIGFSNYVSKAYVHHVGSATIGHNYKALNDASIPWLIENRPSYVKKWFGGP